VATTRTGRRDASASLREHLVNEGLAVQVSRAISPGHAAWEYSASPANSTRACASSSPLARAIEHRLDRAGLGLRLRWLSGGMSDEARTVERTVIPERAGYFISAPAWWTAWERPSPPAASRWAVRASTPPR
jgi:hypothetical protein